MKRLSVLLMLLSSCSGGALLEPQPDNQPGLKVTAGSTLVSYQGPICGADRDSTIGVADTKNTSVKATCIKDYIDDRGNPVKVTVSIEAVGDAAAAIQAQLDGTRNVIDGANDLLVTTIGKVRP